MGWFLNASQCGQVCGYTALTGELCSLVVYPQMVCIVSGHCTMCSEGVSLFRLGGHRWVSSDGVGGISGGHVVTVSGVWKHYEAYNVPALLPGHTRI